MMSEATLFVVDEDSDVRKSVEVMLSGCGFRIETFAKLRDYLDQYDAHRPGCLLLDAVHPALDDLNFTDGMNEQDDHSSALIITGFQQVMLPAALMRTAATGLIEKPFQKEDLLSRVQIAIQLDLQTRRCSEQHLEFAGLLNVLSNREQEVFEHVLQGKSTKAIATALGSSYHTVRNQRSSILRKLKVDTIVDAVRMASHYRSFEFLQNVFGSTRD